jgi:hypothetical protein
MVSSSTTAPVRGGRVARERNLQLLCRPGYLIRGRYPLDRVPNQKSDTGGPLHHRPAGPGEGGKKEGKDEATDGPGVLRGHGEPKGAFASPFQKPGSRNSQVYVCDGNGDGVPDQVGFTAVRGKRKVTATMPA